METVAQKTKRIIADALGADQRLLTYDTHLQHDLGADSLDVLEVITLLETEFGVSVNYERIEYMKRVGDFVKYFEEKKFVPLQSQPFQAA
jgi:acyl carrier protein